MFRLNVMAILVLNNLAACMSAVLIVSAKTDIGTHSTCYHKTGGRLNKKDGLTRYVDSHVKDKTS